MLLDNLEKVLTAAGREKSQVSFCIWGKHGIGKTQLIKRVAKSLGYNFRNIRLSQVDPTELIGFPTRKKETIQLEDGREEQLEYLDYDPPRWYVDAMRGKYIIFLDELNRAKPDVVNAAFELVQERELNGRKLPADVLIIVACNPDSVKYTTNSIFDDEALNDRFCHIKTESNFDVWKSWAREKGENGKPRIDRRIVEFLSSTKSGNAFDHVDQKDHEAPFECKPSPRSWEKVDDLMNLNLSLDLKQELIEGIIGPELAANFINSLRAGNKPITVEEVFELSQETIEKIKSYSDVLGENPDFDLSTQEGEVVAEIALLNVTCEALADTEDEQLRQDVQKNFDKVLRFLELIPPDLAQKTLKKLCSGQANKRFWNQKLNEMAVDSKGNELKRADGSPRYRWQILIDSLEQLAVARENVSERVNNLASVKKPS